MYHTYLIYYKCRLLTLTFLYYFLPFLLHILFLRFTSLENNGNGENDHPNDHPRDVDSEILAQVVFGGEDD
jgi:hypothetical protein